MKKLLTACGSVVILAIAPCGFFVSYAQTQQCQAANAHYNSLYSQCQCDDGYVASKAGTSCITKDQSCQEQFDEHSYSSGDNTCGCLDGYALGDSGKCIAVGLISQNYPLSYGPFNFKNLLIFTIILAIAYLIVWIWGNGLNKRFGKDVDHFIKDQSKELVVGKYLLRSYGTLLVLLLPFVIILFVYAAYVTVMFGIAGIYVGGYASFVGYWIALAVVLFLTASALCVGFYRLFFPINGKNIGIWLSEKDNPKLWRVVSDVASKLSTRPVDKIVIRPNPGIGVQLEGPTSMTLFGGGNKVLMIGIPSVYRLTVGEFTAILAHEYGHFNNRDTQWSTFTSVMGGSLRSALGSMPGPSKGAMKLNINFMTILASLNPTYYIVRFFTMLYFRITLGFSRVREVMADIASMQLYGGAAFEKGLLKVATNESVFNKEIEKKHVLEMVKQGKTIPDFTRFMESFYNDAAMHVASEKLVEERATSGTYDSHPALKIRMDYARKFLQKEEVGGQESFGTLFDDWDKLNKDIAALYNQRFEKYLATLAQSKIKEEQGK